MDMRVNKDDLLATLRDRLTVAKAWDKQQLALHQKAEKAHLDKFRAALKEALKWDYPTAKQHRFTVKVSDGRPSCPRSMERHVERCIALVERSPQQKYIIREDSSANSELYLALTFDVPRPLEVC